jgi:hypothetical protein
MPASCRSAFRSELHQPHRLFSLRVFALQNRHNDSARSMAEVVRHSLVSKALPLTQAVPAEEALRGCGKSRLQALTVCSPGEWPVSASAERLNV